MLRRVKVKSLPKAKDGGVSYNQLAPMYMPNNMGLKPTEVRDSLTAVPREEANLEAEGGETALVPNVKGLPAHYKIKGNRHTEGGVPLNLPNDTFIFSDTRAMIIKDPDVLAEFGEVKPKTPAQIAKKYDINKYREILSDPDMDNRSKSTAERMISNYNIKLAKLATYQESMKGFDGGVPTVAMPYLADSGINPQDLLPVKQQQAPQQQMLEEEIYAEENPSEEEYEAEQDIPQAQFGGGRLGRRLRDFFRGSRQFDPTTGIYMNTDAQGRVTYVDGRGVAMPANIALPQGFMTPGTVVGSTQTTGSGKKQKVVTKTTASKAKVDPSKIKKADDPNLKVGDYYRDDEGKLRKVTKVGYSKTPIGTTYSGPEDYKPTTKTIEQDVLEANVIMEDLAKKGFAEKDKNGGWIIFSGAKDALSIEDKDFLTKVASYNKAAGLKELGAPGFKISSQSQYQDNKRKTKNDTGFYGFADPQMLEYRYWQATNPKGTIEDFKKMDDAAKVQNRKGMLALYGYDVEKLGDKVNDPAKLYTKEFVTDPKAGLTARNELTFKGKDAKTYRSADDAKIGLDHLDAYSLAPEYGNELIPEDTSEDIEIDEFEDPGVTDQYEAEPWLQDVIRTAGAFGDLNRIKKYTPWAPKLNPYVPEPTFYDPTRELAAINEQVAIGTEGASAFAPAQAYNARQAQIQAQGAKTVADVLGRYNNLNVGQANQFDLTKANIYNQTNTANAEVAKNLYDQMTIANQQYDNAKAQARQELRQGYIDLITNQAQAQAMNETYGDHFIVDPSSGGYVKFTGKTKDLLPSSPYNDQMVETFKSLREQLPEADDATLLKLMGKNEPTNYADDYMKALASMYPVQTGAGYGSNYEG